MGINKQRLSLREGSVILDGVELLDSVTAKAVYKPDVSASRVLGSRGKDRRWLGYDIEVTISEYRSTPWLHEVIQKYKDTGKTPEFIIQGIQHDKGSDYNEKYGDETRTIKGCVITSDISIFDLDTNGELVQDTITFGGKELI